MIAAPMFWMLTGLAAAQAPITGEVVDAKGQPVAGAEVVLSVGLTKAGTVPILAQVRSDEAGRFTFDPNASRTAQAIGTIWGFKTGLAVGVIDRLRDNQPGRVHRLVLPTADVRTLTIVDAEGKPVAGARVTPRMVQTENTRYPGVFFPDAWLDHLSVLTDSRGNAPLPSLTGKVDLRVVLINLPGQVRHVVPLPYAAVKQDVTLTLGAPARFAGRIRTPSGAPVAGATIEVWARTALPLDASRAVYSTPEPVSMGTVPLRARADGTFQTPPVLMNGSTYRVVARKDGFAPALSDWVQLSGTPAPFLAVTLRPLVSIQGRVVDRQGQAVAGARVFQPGGKPEATSDEAGRFTLEQARPTPSFLLARKAGFRFHGQPTSAGAYAPIELVLTRQSEPPSRRMATLAAPISVDQSRALVRRLLDPILKDAIANGDDSAKLWLLRVFRWIDPAGLLEQVEKAQFQRPGTANYLKGCAALGLAAADPVEAEAVAETITDASDKAGTLVDLVDALPATERPRKLALLERAATQARRADLGSKKLFQMGEVAERWLEMGEKDKPLALFADGLKLVEALPPPNRRAAGSFLYHLARVDPKSPVELLKGVGEDRWNQRILANIANRAAYAFPAEAEHVLGLLHESVWRYEAGFRVCFHLAANDPERARRIASRIPDARERAYAWTFLADGLLAKDPTAARAALDQAIQEIDGPSDPDPEQFIYQGFAESILPMVERIDPDRVAEVFWRSVAQDRGREDPRMDFGSSLSEPPIAQAMLLSRYDRAVAATLFEPVAAFVRSRPLRGGANDLTPATILALGCLDPVDAVKQVEALPRSGSLDINETTNWLRYTLAEHLAMPPERRWMGIWRFHSGCGTAMFEDIYREL